MLLVMECLLTFQTLFGIRFYLETEMYYLKGDFFFHFKSLSHTRIQRNIKNKRKLKTILKTNTLKFTIVN